jgi:hypothetical protein
VVPEIKDIKNKVGRNTKFGKNLALKVAKLIETEVKKEFK